MTANPYNISRLVGALWVLGAVLLAMAVCGCSEPQSSAIAVEPAIIQGQELVVWQACQDELHSRGFVLDRAERRSGEIATMGRVSSQWFEFWGRDTATSADIAESSLRTIRRQVNILVEPLGEDEYQVGCVVTVERFAPLEPEVGGTMYAGDVLARSANRTDDNPNAETGLDTRQWETLGQDAALAEEILKSIESRVYSVQ
ncbi:MAG: hypothetical protein JW936_07185 [Sedimentisphaerales bacterium]|nr:hypothetical protein [Sedimentisphaerales bacterium]